MRHGPHDVDVVRHQDVAQAIFLLQLGKQLEHLLLDSDVERAGRLVEHHDLRLDDQRPRDGDALPLAAGELVRIAVEERLGTAAFRQADVEERRQDAFTALPFVELRLVDLEALADDLLDGEPRRER